MLSPDVSHTSLGDKGVCAGAFCHNSVVRLEMGVIQFIMVYGIFGRGDADLMKSAGGNSIMGFVWAISNCNH